MMTRRGLARAFVLAASVAVLVSLPSIRNGYVLDDVWVIQDNEIVHDGSLSELVTSTYWPPERGGAMWRPVALVGFAVQWRLGDGQPLLFHIVNIALYGLVAGLAAVVAGSLFNVRVGMIAGVLFAIHPVHVEVTANVVGQTELLAGLGYLLALWGAWEHDTAPRATRPLLLLVVAAGVAVGIAGKEYLVTFPGAVLVLWWLRWKCHGEPIAAIWRKGWQVLVVSTAIIAVYLVIRARIAYGVAATGGAAMGLDENSVISRLTVMLPVSLRWLELLFAPVRLSADYELRHLVPDPVFGLKHVVALIIWTALLVAVWNLRRKLPEIFTGTALFLVTVSIVSNVVVPTGVILAERLLFLPSFGWCIAVSGLIVFVAERSGGRQRKMLVVALTAVALVASARSMLRARVWKDNEVFFAQMLKDAPNSFRVHWAIGIQAFERGDSILGEREMRLAVQLNPSQPYLLEDLGLMYYVTGRYEPAVPLLEQAVAVDSNRLSSALPLARSLARVGETDRAFDVLNAMARLHGETRGIEVVRSEILIMVGRFEEALQVLEPLVAREPRVWTLRSMLAQAASNTGQCGVAIAQLDTALQLAPETVQAELGQLRARLANGNAPCK
jgi:Flp pilus assembly protein TadD